MPPITAPVPTAAKADPRVAAYCAPEGPEVFSGVVHGNQIWAPDRFDVEAVHRGARDGFQRLLSRASGADAPPHGVSLLLLGEAGSGKTHLMRAFRTAAHEQGTGYCGYMQMLCRADSYPRYVLSYLIDSLEQPYRPGDPTTGLMRLARGLLDALELDPADVEQLCEDHLDLSDLAKRVFRFAEIAVQIDRFKHIDVNVLRAFLFLLANDGRVRPKVLSWLRCEDLAPFDREALGGLVPRPGPEMPLKTIVSLGQLMRALPTPAALVLLVDQMDETLELGKTDAEPGEQFRSAVGALIDITESLPSAVVVIGCIEELFNRAKAQGYLPRAKLDRLEHNPEPLRLRSERTADEIAEIAAARLDKFFDDAGVATDPANPIAPYTAADLAPLAGMRTRDILDFFREHRQRCAAAAAWVPPSVSTQTKEVAVRTADFAQLWNDFLPTVKPPIVDEPKLAELLAWAVSATTDEMSNGLIIGTDKAGRFVQTELQSGEAVDKVLLAICDKGAQGNGLKNQINETVARAGENRAVFIRSTEFSKNPTAEIAKQLAQLCAPVGKHRRVVVANADWRTMTAFRLFAQKHSGELGFGGWRKRARPLANLPSLQRILDLDRRDQARAPAPMSEPALQTMTAREQAVQEASAASPMSTDRVRSLRDYITLGQTRGSTPTSVDLEPKSLCRHAAFVGGSGSGKTTAALAAIEHLLLAGVPAVLLDRK
ncbi:MAG TPA: ATP-binding protein, partial [Gemmata sp.]